MSIESQQNLERIRFRVKELDCAEEILQLRHALENQPGIGQLEFDILNSRMTVEFDSAMTSLAEIIDHVANAGLHARVWEKQSADETGSWAEQHALTIFTVAAGILMLAGLCWHTAVADFSTALGYGAETSGVAVPFVVRLLYSLSILAGIRLVAPKAWGALRRFRPDMNLLMAVAVVGALILGQWFEAAMVTFLFSLALLLEHWSMGRARRAISALMNLSPETANCMVTHDDHTHTVERPVGEVAVGTTIVVQPGEKIPLDGVVLKGTSSVNEAPITGESIPVAKQPDDELFAGTINEEATLEFQSTKSADNTTLARIVQMVEEAQSRRAPSEQWVETFARYYTPAMMLLAMAVTVGPPLLVSAAWAEWVYRGLVVLVIACPCALVISTPVSIVSALTSSARNGVLIKGGRYLEAAAHIRALAMDKTGTLTSGHPVVQKIVTLNGHNEREVLQRAASLEMNSRHPLARAILRRAKEEEISTERAEDYRMFGGKGAEGVFDGRPFWIGSHRFLHEKIEEPPEVHEQALALEDAGHSVVAVGNDDHVCGLISIADEVRADVGETLVKLKGTGIQSIVMLTGDNEKTAAAVAKAVGIEEYRAELLPEDKVREVETLCEQYGAVAMIGDGVNDAPAMAAATLGIAMGAIGTDTAIETADIALMSDDLSKVPWLMQHARRTVSIVRQNIVFALGLKLLFVVLTLFGMASLWMAIAADMGASLLVIFNGLRLLRA